MGSEEGSEAGSEEGSDAGWEEGAEEGAEDGAEEAGTEFTGREAFCELCSDSFQEVNPPGDSLLPEVGSLLISEEGSEEGSEDSSWDSSGVRSTVESGITASRPVPSTSLRERPATRLTPKNTMTTAMNCSQIYREKMSMNFFTV
ncbi:MAG: hypothetical protein IKM31_09970 [Oscillospiraceae bacterium]|nr:hypothetical protein [Oscillospiraceae bacterium]